MMAELAAVPAPQHSGADNTVAAVMQERDWAASPLGPPGWWSPSLRTALDIILASGSPMAIDWGPGTTLTLWLPRDTPTNAD